MSEPKIIILARGEEDKLLSGDNPEHSFFTQSINKYSYFGQNWNVLECPKSPLPQNCKVEFRLPIQGDLLSNMMLRIRLKDFTASYNKDLVALDIIDYITISHNGRPLATLDSNYIALHHKLNCNDSQYTRFVDETSIKDKNKINRNYSYSSDTTQDSRFLHIPLPFWFTKNPGSSFPIWLLDNPNITITIQLNE